MYFKICQFLGENLNTKILGNSKFMPIPAQCAAKICRCPFLPYITTGLKKLAIETILTQKLLI